MKNIILILVLCFTINNIKAQQFSGIYMQPPTPNDIVINTAITNFVSTKMLKIDTYIEPNTGVYYFELTFLGDNLNPVGQSIRYESSSNERLMINDVKYDAVNDCYIACGNFYNNGEAAFIINFDNMGMINWKTSAYNFAAQRGANEYRRVEVCTLRSGVTVYAACGYGFTGAFERGIIGFYDQSGSLLSMYKSNPGSVYSTLYTDIVYNPDNNRLGLTGTFKDQYQNQTVNSGYLFNEYNVMSAIPSTITSTIRYGQSVEANGITYDPNSAPFYKYYISGSDVYNGNLFVSQTNLLNSGTTEQFYYTSGIGISDISVSDNCINNSDPIISKLGVTGFCINNGIKQGFMADINLFSIGFPIINFSEWMPNGLPFIQTSFQHIIYRDNMAVTPNYSYILYGLPQFPNIPLSYIAEYYPDPAFWHCAEHQTNVMPMQYIPFNYMPNPENSFPYSDAVPDFNITYSYQILNYECNQPPVFSTLNHTQRHKTTLLNNQGLIKSENGNIILNEDYTRVICNIYNINGQLIAEKEQGKQIINGSAFSNGIYFLQPLTNSTLKPIKFNITH